MSDPGPAVSGAPGDPAPLGDRSPLNDTAHRGAQPSTRVVIFGDVFDDIIVRPDAPIRSDTDTLASIERRAGGSAANTAAWLGSLGTRVDFVGRVNVADVDRHANLLRDSGVTPRLSGENVLPTGAIIVIVESAASTSTSVPDAFGATRVPGAAVDTRTMLTERGANALVSPDDIDDEVLAHATHLHFSGYTLFSGQPLERFRSLFDRCRQIGVTISVDPGSSGFIDDHGADAFLEATAGADLVFPNLDEGIALTGQTEPGAILDSLTHHFPTVALTLGRSGALVGTASGLRVAAPCVPVEPVDTTGAGDAFDAGFLAGLFAEVPDASTDQTVRLRRAAELGVATASQAITVVGARPPGFVTTHGQGHGSGHAALEHPQA